MQSRWLPLLGIVVVGIFWGCGVGEGADGESQEPDPNHPGRPSIFESDDPSGNNSGNGAGGASSGGSGGSSGAAGSATGGSGGGGAGGTGGAEKAIEEADVIQLQGTKLYTLSRYGGLNIIDVSVKDQLKLIGHHAIEGEPFEMYVRDGVVLAMYSSYGHYEGGYDSWQWVQSSAVVALNAKDPAKITKIGEFLMPGAISDSRIVGDVLYAVSYEDGYCWKCKNSESTTVISLDVTVPSQVAKVDELAFTTPNGYYGWGRRSVTVNQSRMFIGGRDYSGGNGSTVDIVDISDPNGKLVKGASVPVAGEIESRWQMDEKDGVLRVISQPGWWSTDNPPIVQTFQVVSSQQITPIASLPMKLPQPERLRSVRFDGARAYAITAVQTDPLFVIDLSDPKNPQQLGELEMPGWVYHMEPRGDRLFAVGFDNQNADGALNVSLFDVADATAPKLIERVAFGGQWGQFAEDQDRIHKAFAIMDQLGAIFVPYSGYLYDGYGCSEWKSGIQIIDFTKDSLTKRGNASSRGQARRALMVGERLFSVSDVAVETFDIANRDAPVAKANLALANVVSHVAAAGNKIVRIGSDWYTSKAVIDVVAAGSIERPASNAVDLEAALGAPSGSQCNYGYSYYYGVDQLRLYTYGNYAYVVAGGDELRIAVFDISSGTPVSVGKLTVPGLSGSESGYYGYWYQGYGTLLSGGSNVVQTGSTVVLLRQISHYSYETNEVIQQTSYEVLDFSNPKSPKHTSLTIPNALGVTALQLAGGKVLTSHWEPSPTTKGKVRFYLDRFDLTNPSAPKWATPVNVPGSLVLSDSTMSRAITASYEKFTEETTSDDCYDKWGSSAVFDWDSYYSTYTSGTCTGTRRTLHLVSLTGTVAKLDSKSLPDDLNVSQLALGTDRVFMSTDDYDYYGSGSSSRIEVVSGLVAGKLELGSVQTPKTAGSYYYSYMSQLIPQGTRAIALGGYPSSVWAVDAASPSAPTIQTLVEDIGDPSYYYYSYPATLIGNTLVLPRGVYGVKLIDVSP